MHLALSYNSIANAGYISCDWFELVICLLTFYCDPYFLFQILILVYWNLSKKLMCLVFVIDIATAEENEMPQIIHSNKGMLPLCISTCVYS